MATPKQEKLITLLLENYGNKDTRPLGELLLEAGYSPASAKNPKIVIDSKEVQDGIAKVAEDINYLRQKAIAELRKRDIKKEPYRDVVKAIDIYTKNHQLLSGGETERAGVTIELVKYEGDNPTQVSS